jgi:hypothetical protein
MSSDPLRILQEDCYARLLVEPGLATIAILLQRKAVTTEEVKRLLSVVNARGGKAGACIIVEMPTIAVPEPNVPGPRGLITQAFTVFEHPTLNATSVGTGMNAEAIAIAVLQLFHHFVDFGVTGAFVASGPAIMPDLSLDGLVGYQVLLQTALGLQKVAKVATPVVTPSSGSHNQQLTLTCATAGAAIWYTVDGSYPASNAPGATRYTAPFSPAAACTLRFAAEFSGLQQSDIYQATFT